MVELSSLLLMLRVIGLEAGGALAFGRVVPLTEGFLTEDKVESSTVAV